MTENSALRTSYRLARRLAVGLLGTTVVLVGIAMLVLPGPAMVVIPAGLAILSIEFAWARRWLRKVREQTEKALRRRGNEERNGDQQDSTKNHPPPVSISKHQ